MIKFQEKNSKDQMYTIRISDAEKKWLDKRLEACHTRLNRKREDNQKIIPRGTILIEALRLGFAALEND